MYWSFPELVGAKNEICLDNAKGGALSVADIPVLTPGGPNEKNEVSYAEKLLQGNA